VLLFGAGRIGEVGKGLGEGIRNFKKGIAGGDDEDGDEKDAAEAKQLKKGSKDSEDESSESKTKAKKG
jgi:sec-independent protein translocase protein TatA